MAVAMLVLSGPGTRAGAWTWQAGFALMKWAMFVGFGAAAFALVLLAIPRTRGPRPSVLVAALLMGVMAGAPLLSLMAQAKRLPYIHDVTTDMLDPPLFVSLMPARRAAPNGAAYGGPDIAAQQRRAYPNVQALRLAASPEQAFRRVHDAAVAMGWDIAAADAASGRLEATATTLWFGFKDDVIVRVRAEGNGSRIDVRSVSRVGQSDLGANARRIQEFLRRLT